MQPSIEPCVCHTMVLSSPTFRVEILPNALAALPELFSGVDSVLPALDLQLEEILSPQKARPTEMLITSNVEQAILDTRPIFLVHPNPDSKLLSGLIDTGRPMRWIPKGTPEGSWVDSFARFLHALRTTTATAPWELQPEQPVERRSRKRAS